MGALYDGIVFAGGLAEAEIAEQGVVLHYLREFRVLLLIQRHKLAVLLLAAVHDKAFVLAGFRAGSFLAPPNAPAHIHGLKGLIPHSRFPDKAHMSVVPLAGGR